MRGSPKMDRIDLPRLETFRGQCSPRYNEPMAILDTTPQIAKLQADILKRMCGSERLRLTIDMSDTMRGLTFTRLKREHPGISERDLVYRFFKCVLPAEEIPSSLR